MISAKDAWVLRRLLVGQTLNGELEEVSGPFRDIADRLAGLPPEGRQGAWNGFLDGQAGKDDIIRALAAADPLGPAPPPGSGENGATAEQKRQDGPQPAGSGSWPYLDQGRRVRATDRDNYGTVEEDLGDRARVHFVSPEGSEARPVLPKSLLRNPDGSPLIGTGDDGWPPLRFVELPPVDPFPVDVLPGPAARLVIEGAESIGCPPDYLALPVLAAAGGVIGRSVVLRLKDGYLAGAAIYGACVGMPSDGKTPGLKAAAAAIRLIDEALVQEFAEAMEDWEQETKEPSENGAKEPPKPKRRRIEVDDITMEAIPSILADNARGLIMVRDELNALFMGMNQYKGGRGNDRAIVLKIWSGDAITKDRVGHEDDAPIRCPYPAMSIIGGLTPDMLGELLDPKGRSDGFIDRFLFAYPDPRPVPSWSERGVSEEAASGWADLVDRLWKRPMGDEDGRPVPRVAHFTPEGKACWVEHYDAHTREMNDDDFPPALRGPWGKFREYAGRLALILACLRHAADPAKAPDAIPEVGAEDVARAWRLVAYFKSHARRVHAAISRGPGMGGGPVVKAIVAWLRQDRRESFTVRDLTQARRTIKDADLADALRFLVGRDAIRLKPAPPKNPAGGRPPSPEYEVNPSLLDTHNPQNPRKVDPSPPVGRGSEGSEGSESE
jgi:hypothetical protein